jgi:MFS superfamily sulfate permease-like transporter
MFAGCFTAIVFYAEYIGMGVVLGGALPGPVASSVALGCSMVVGAVIVSCALGAALREPLLAGPRAASLAVLVAGMKFSADYASDEAARLPAALAALATLLMVAALTQLAGTLPSVRAWLAGTSVALRKGFVFSTAVGIVVGLASAQLDGCLRVNPALTVAVMSASVAAALSWSRWCNRPGSGPRRRRLAPFSLIVGTALASAGYYALLAPQALEDLCATVGSAAPEGAPVLQTVISVASLDVAARSLPAWIWPVLVLAGALLGLVLLLESLTALRETREPTPPAVWSAHLKLRALVNVAASALGLACSSVSLVRTNALMESAGYTRLAVLFHGVALVAILLFLHDWISVVPQLAVAVALMLLAIQMIDDETRTQVWRSGYGPNASPARVRSAWAFWGVVAMSLAAGAALHAHGWGFGGGPLMALFVGMAWTGKRLWQERRQSQRSQQSLRRPG